MARGPWIVLAGLLALLAPRAEAQVAPAPVPGFATTTVNLRAGPGVQYPVVVVLPASAALAVHGCIPDYSWCDASWGQARGWVAARFISVAYQGQTVVLTPPLAPVIGIAAITFTQAYWQAHYVGWPWYARWGAYYRPLPPPPPPVVVVGRPPVLVPAPLVRAPLPGPAYVPPPVTRTGSGSCADGSCSGNTTVTGPAGRSATRSGSVDCANGSCSGGSTVTGPEGRSATRSGSVTCTGGNCSGNRTVTGPRGGSFGRSGSFHRP